MIARKDDFSYSAGNGMTELTASLNLTWYLAGIVLFALFWNCAFTLFHKYQWFADDRESAVIFLGVFIAGNVFWFITFCYYMLFYYIGQPMLKISNPSPRLGEEVTLAWELPDYRSVSRLVIALEGFECLEDISGEKTADSLPHTHVIASVKLADTAEMRDMKSGNAVFKIPGGSMHSFDCYRFKIVWQLKLQAEKKWKDRRLEYVINVKPYEI
ncbi:MAG: hypothetical protein ACYC4Q_12115 [Victivallaceae bacterium]